MTMVLAVATLLACLLFYPSYILTLPLFPLFSFDLSDMAGESRGREPAYFRSNPQSLRLMTVSSWGEMLAGREKKERAAYTGAD